MSSAYCYIVGADYKYVPELCALLNSLQYVGNLHDVHVLGIHLPEEFTEQFKNIKGYEIIYHNIPEEEVQESRGISEVVCRKRYWYAGMIGQEYRCVCVLDADLIFNRDPWQFFHLAEATGFILGPCKEQNKVYDDPHQQADGKWIIEEGFWNDKDLCNCPLFLDTKIWGPALQKSWNIFIDHNFKAPDMDAMNICFIEAGAYDQIVKLPGIQWLGTNEQMLKTYQRATIRRDGKLWTEGGLEIFCFHGHYYHKKWRDCQLANRKHCIKGRLDGSEKSYGDAVGALDVLTGVFNKMLDFNIHIEKKNYRE